MKFTFVLKFSANRKIQPVTIFNGETKVNFIKRAEYIAAYNAKQLSLQVLDLELIELDDAHRAHLLKVMGKDFDLNTDNLAGDYLIIIIYRDTPNGHKKDS